MPTICQLAELRIYPSEPFVHEQHAEYRAVTNNHYDRWDEPDCIRRFSEKRAGDFFKSETRLLSRIMPDVRSVLDIGCASGRFLDLLHQWRDDVEYTGIDISATNIRNARTHYSNALFHHTNALDFDCDRTFDLVNATGVMQHEPRFEDLIRKMLSLSSTHVLFDVKLAKIEQHMVDRSISYAGSKKSRLYFNLLSYTTLRTFLLGLSGVRNIEIYGYVTTPNQRTHVPVHISTIVSASILLEKGDSPRGQVTVDETLPGSIIEDAGN